MHPIRRLLKLASHCEWDVMGRWFRLPSRCKRGVGEEEGIANPQASADCFLERPNIEPF
jgi:hypothetical protein